MHARQAFAALCAALLVAPAAAEWVTFPPAAAGALGERDEHGAYPVRGYLSTPLEPGRHPAVVLLPSCEGRRTYHDTWADVLGERGYAALVVDDYFMRDRGGTCGVREPAARAKLLRMRIAHALGAERYLAARPDVDPARMAVMGWGDAPLAALLGEARADGADGGRFEAVVAMTPATCEGLGAFGPRPLLILQAESGGAAPRECRGDASDTSVREVRVYQETVPGFDDPRAVPEATAGALAATRRYHRLAHARAIEDVAAFLDRRLPPPEEGARDYATATAPVVPEHGVWAVDPNAPEPDRPPLGASAFDLVFSRAGADGVAYDVPFPFPRLLEVLERAAGGESMQRSPLDATLIPLGRSLQREAAAPEYFQSPRIVVAVTGEPDTGTGPLGVRLENRLFLGYQPRAKVIEVISYNEAANRFEFQVVRDYGAGLEPRVRYARRALCMSCHQNAGPIFADAGWDETTANAEVARRLQRLAGEFHGVPVSTLDRTVAAIDTATDEANLLPVYRRLWSEGCASRRPAEAARCRAGALLAMVQYRLSGAAGFDREAPLYAGAYLRLQRRNWSERWPEGLLIPSANLANRSPLMSPSPSVVPVALDPLRRRPPLARWRAASRRDLERLIRGLSRSLPERHMALLDRHLRAAGAAAAGRTLTAACKVVRRGFAGQPRLLEIECGAERPATARDGFRLQAQIQVRPAGSAEGEAGWLEVDGGAYARRALAGRIDDGSAGDPRVTLGFVERDGQRALRSPDGNAFRSLTIDWDQSVEESATRFDAVATLAVEGDFEPLASLMERLAAEASPASPLLAARFDGVELAGWLLSALGVGHSLRCCDPRPAPEPSLDAGDGPSEAVLELELAHRGPLLTFARYCGACHGGDSAHPPGFLHARGASLLASVGQCAERIYYRLSMWHRRTEERAVEPMPPEQGLRLAGTHAAAWRRSESLERLIDYARGRLTEEGRDPDALLERSYRSARPCLAAGEESAEVVSSGEAVAR